MKMVDSFEKIPLEIFPNAQAGSEYVARQIAALIREKEKIKSVVCSVFPPENPL